MPFCQLRSSKFYYVLLLWFIPIFFLFYFDQPFLTKSILLPDPNLLQYKLVPSLSDHSLSPSAPCSQSHSLFFIAPSFCTSFYHDGSVMLTPPSKNVLQLHLQFLITSQHHNCTGFAIHSSSRTPTGNLQTGDGFCLVIFSPVLSILLDYYSCHTKVGQSQLWSWKGSFCLLAKLKFHFQ